MTQPVAVMSIQIQKSHPKFQTALNVKTSPWSSAAALTVAWERGVRKEVSLLIVFPDNGLPTLRGEKSLIMPTPRKTGLQTFLGSHYLVADLYN